MSQRGEEIIMVKAFKTQLGTVLVHEYDCYYTTVGGVVVTRIGILTPMDGVKTETPDEVFYNIDLKKD